MIRRKLLIPVILLMIFMPWIVNAEEANGTVNNVNWNYKDGVLTFSTENDSRGYIISSVTNPFGTWLNYKNDITKIIIKDGIDLIASNAFKEYANLEEVELPKSMGGFIGDYAFYNCSKLKKITLPEGLTRIGDYAFYGTDIHEVELPIYLDWIYDHTFNDDITITRPEEYDEIIAAGTSGNMKNLTESMGNGKSSDNTCYNKFYYSSFYDDTSYWKLYKDGTLVVFGSELTSGYNGSRNPWGCYKKQIKKVIINEDVEGKIRVDDSICTNKSHVKFSIYASKPVEEIMQKRIKRLWGGNYIFDCREDCRQSLFNVNTIIINRGVESIENCFWSNEEPIIDKNIYINKYVKTIDSKSMFGIKYGSSQKTFLHLEVSPNDYRNNGYNYTLFYPQDSQYSSILNGDSFISDPLFNSQAYNGEIVNDVDDTYVSINDTSAPNTIEIEGKTYYKYDTYLTNSEGITNVSLPKDENIEYYIKIVDNQESCENTKKTYKVDTDSKVIEETLEIKNKIFIADIEETDTVTIEVEDPDNVKYNQIVKLKVKPIDGYTVNDIIITDMNNNIIEYKKIDNDEYEFIMPDTDITIQPIYRKVEKTNIIDIIKNPKTGEKFIKIALVIILSFGIGTYSLKKKRI